MLKTIATYVCLVGIPLAGLIWILDYGEQLDAPPSVAGHWQLEGVDLASCLDTDTRVLSVQQSGRFLQITLGGASGEARLDDARLHGQLLGLDGPCGSLDLEGQLDETHERFVGQVSGSACDRCREVEVVGARSEAEAGPEKGH